VTAPAASPRGLPRTSLAVRIAASGLLVAIVAVAAAALVSLRLVGVTAREVTQDVLARQADVVAAQLADAPPGNVGLRWVADVLRGQGISIVLIGPRGARLGGDEAATTAVARTGADRAADGTPVSGQAVVGGTTLLVEARPARTGAFALVQTAETAPAVAPQLRRNIGFALLAGVGAALVVGVLAGRLLARPLRRTAAAARALRSGRRDVRVPVAGPVETADVAHAVNELADALERSEGRQRRFLLSVSHELRTPLTAVSGFAESLADSVVTGDEVPEVGRTMLREAQRLNRLVDDLLELARLEADDFRLDLVVLDLVALAAEAAAVWSALCAQAGVAFRLGAPAGPVLVHADPRRLRQVVDGLADNALRVTPAGAPLVLAVRAVPGGGVIEVRDGGPGLAPTTTGSCSSAGPSTSATGSDAAQAASAWRSCTAWSPAWAGGSTRPPPRRAGSASPSLSRAEPHAEPAGCRPEAPAHHREHLGRPQRARVGGPERVVPEHPPPLLRGPRRTLHRQLPRPGGPPHEHDVPGLHTGPEPDEDDVPVVQGGGHRRPLHGDPPPAHMTSVSSGSPL
jgi:two-component system OmpR family sensor kinase